MCNDRLWCRPLATCVVSSQTGRLDTVLWGVIHILSSSLVITFTSPVRAHYIGVFIWIPSVASVGHTFRLRGSNANLDSLTIDWPRNSFAYYTIMPVEEIYKSGRRQVITTTRCRQHRQLGGVDCGQCVMRVLTHVVLSLSWSLTVYQGGFIIYLLSKFICSNLFLFAKMPQFVVTTTRWSEGAE